MRPAINCRFDSGGIPCLGCRKQLPVDFRSTLSDSIRDGGAFGLRAGYLNQCSET
jgi:hypothetical protein